jgi:hypothetical protein
VAVNATLNTALKERRESKKRTREHNNAGGMAGMELHATHQAVETAAEVAAKQPRTDDGDGEANIMEEIHQQEAVAMEVPVPEPMAEHPIEAQEVMVEEHPGAESTTLV